ncbi:MAG: UDP-glucose 4-epimerase GalE [Oscillospiraceae bacterium]|jgi:UDP-glucose 4-epimerase|nr:UDP-glucose 4-epimerase GalE [Oscillospiraceae bacterium]
MNIFVTGGAGYIGTHTILELLALDYNVVAVDDFSNSKPDAIERVKELAGRDFTFYEANVCDINKMDEIFSKHKFDCVIHFAGKKAPGESVEKPLEYYKNNLDSTMALCEVMKKNNVKKIVFSSSCTVYGANNPMPLTENSSVGECINPYGWTKFMCEQILTDVVNVNKDWSVALLRYFNPVGAHESGRIGEDPQGIPINLMPHIAQTVVGRIKYLHVFGDDYDTPDGTCIRDYIHVVDVAKGHVAAIKYIDKNAGVSTFNLGTGDGTSVLEFISTFETATNKNVPYKISPRRPGDAPICYASIDKAEKELHWKAEKSLANACEDTWRWQSMNPNGYERKNIYK